jgi:hypothetical protein
MTIYEAFVCLADENADPDAVRQVRAVVQDICRKIDEIKDGLKDRYLVLSPCWLRTVYSSWSSASQPRFERLLPRKALAI